MTDETTAAPEGVSEPAAIDQATAVDRIMAMDNPPEAEQPEAAAAEQPAPDASEPEATAEPTPEQAQPEAENTELQIKADAKTRLRDGREVSIGDLKRRFEKADELEAEINKFRERETERSQKAQQQQLLEQHLPSILHQLQAQMPKAPEIALAETDPIEYTVQRARYEQRVTELRAVEAAQQQQIQKSKTEQDAKFQEFLKGEQERILEKLPELKDPEKGKKWKEDYDKTVKHYGFSAEEAGQVYDHRLVLMANDAMQFRALQAQKAEAVEKAKQPATTTAVLSPQRRVAQAERSSQSVNEAVARARKSGSMADAVAAMSLLD